MNGFKISLIVIVVIVALGAISAVGYRNGLVGMDENLISFNAQVQNMQERRTDLIPQVAAVVKNYVAHERGTLESVTKLRTAGDNLDKLEALGKAGKSNTAEYSNLLSSTLSSIKVTMEAYPTLKADTQFTNLFVELEGSENRIRTAIKDYNDAVGQYNVSVRSFPNGVLFSGLFGFHEKQRINPPEGKDIKSVPNVDSLLKQ